jgi:hypothetical protein
MPSARFTPLAAPVSINSTQMKKKGPRSIPSGLTKEISVTTPASEAPHAKRAAITNCKPNFTDLDKPRLRFFLYFAQSSANPTRAIPIRANTTNNPPGLNGLISRLKPVSGLHIRTCARSHPKMAAVTKTTPPIVGVPCLCA